MPLSVRAWHEMIAKGLAPKRAELIRGVIVEKMPKSILHIILVGRLCDLLKSLLGPQLWVRQEAPLSLADSEPEPDVSVVDGRDADYSSHPTTARLVVKVAVSSLAEDKEMATIYAEAGVTEFWLVNAPERCIEVYRRPVGGRYEEMTVVSQGMLLGCAALPEVKVDLAQLFQEL